MLCFQPLLSSSSAPLKAVALYHHLAVYVHGLQWFGSMIEYPEVLHLGNTQTSCSTRAELHRRCSHHAAALHAGTQMWKTPELVILTHKQHRPNFSTGRGNQEVFTRFWHSRLC